MTTRPDTPRPPFVGEVHDVGLVFLIEALAPATLFMVALSVTLMLVQYALPALLQMML